MEPRPTLLHEPEPRSVSYIKTRHLWIGGLLLASMLGGLGLLYMRPELMLAAAIAVPIGIVLLTRPFVGLMLLITILVVQPGELFPVLDDLHIERVTGGLVLLATVVEFRQSGRKLRFFGHPMLSAMYVFLAGTTLSVFTSIFIGGTVDVIQAFLRTIAYCLLVLNIVRTPRRMTLFIRLFMLLHAYLAFFTLKGYYSGQIVFAQGIARAVGLTSFGGDPNALATTLVGAIPFFVMGFRVERLGRWKILWLLCIAACVWTVVLTGSRAGILSLVCVGMLMWAMSPSRGLSLFLVLTLLSVLWVAMPEQYKTRYLTITNKELDASSEGRIDAWKAGVRMFVEHPLMGVGAGNFSPAHAEQAKAFETRHWLKAHSLYVQLISELGVVGVLTFGFFVIQFLRTAYRLMKKFPVLPRSTDYRSVAVRAALIAFYGLLVSGIFGHNLYRITWHLLAIMLVVAEEARPEGAEAGSGTLA